MATLAPCICTWIPMGLLLADRCSPPPPAPHTPPPKPGEVKTTRLFVHTLSCKALRRGSASALRSAGCGHVDHQCNGATTCHLGEAGTVGQHGLVARSQLTLPSSKRAAIFQGFVPIPQPHPQHPRVICLNAENLIILTVFKSRCKGQPWDGIEGWTKRVRAQRVPSAPRFSKCPSLQHPKVSKKNGGPITQ